MVCVSLICTSLVSTLEPISTRSRQRAPTTRPPSVLPASGIVLTVR
jgi:hypothetical protein